MTATIAVVGGADEPEVRSLTEQLAARGESPLVIDALGFPQRGHLTHRDGRWAYDGIDLAAVRAVFVRSLHSLPQAPQRAADLAARPRSVVAACREKESVLRSLLRGLQAHAALVINPVDALACHALKPDTIDRLARAGVPVPESLVTNDPNEVIAFAARFEEVVYKPVAGGAATSALHRDELAPRRLAELRSAPVLFQRRARGADVRAYVLGGEAIAAGICTVDAVDVRTTDATFSATTLTHGEASAAILAGRTVGLTFAAIDLKRGTGQFTVLDVNPAPMFAAFERMTGFEISAALAQALIGASAA